ncbi:F-box domain-containing protein [Microsporum canis CBS 113480]|uniref:F-box domain-containing protein n=1 Tax=Arthroderma otae (strain ATCC MYA-4605 / CBS 113480) TaxID=554155 RepID=C5FHX7_ARTOC|nr:F-box domain-containing protein [Microsporum canis CBS 113480]EEQ28957.1 F-box domain-containing protein [Microsporum canis CBS 113480]
MPNSSRSNIGMATAASPSQATVAGLPKTTRRRSPRTCCQISSFKYQHVRIDAVHYCELEIELAAKRKKNSFLNHNAEPLDAPRTRLMLFMRTVRDSRALGLMVKSLRMPYMTREANKSELARTVSVLPNLRYVDLPAGFFSDDTLSHTLKQELLARCPDIRRMKFARGAEGSFSRMPKTKGWPNLEVLELSGLNIETNLLRTVLGYFERLTDLKLEDMPSLEDTVFKSVATLPAFPPLQRLTLTDTPKITSQGLCWYLSSPRSRDALRHLSVANTGVEPQRLHEVLAQAPLISSLSMQQEVTREFPPDHVPPLASGSLRLLHYEITSECGSYGVQALSTSYYTYLMSSLLTGALPGLTDLYVRDANFPETLMLAPPPPVFGDGGRQSHAGAGLNQALSVYSKGVDELEWNFTAYQPFAEGGRRMSASRPVSLHGAQLSPAWGGEARRSVLRSEIYGGDLSTSTLLPLLLFYYTLLHLFYSTTSSTTTSLLLHSTTIPFYYYTILLLLLYHYFYSSTLHPLLLLYFYSSTLHPLLYFYSTLLLFYSILLPLPLM